MVWAGGISDFLQEQYHWRWDDGSVRALGRAGEEKTAKPGSNFKECATGCPTMVVVPAGKFMMGSPENEKDRSEAEGPQHEVTIAKPFAVARSEVTFAEWDTCVAAGACESTGSRWGRGDRPVINVSWDDAKQYVAWLSRMTGKEYRLLTEAEWEYAARAGSQTRFSFGDDESRLDRQVWLAGNSDNRTQPVGKKAANAFGLYDMHGNVFEWVEDAWHDDYEGAPTDGSLWGKEAMQVSVLSAAVPGSTVRRKHRWPPRQVPRRQHRLPEPLPWLPVGQNVIP